MRKGETRSFELPAHNSIWKYPETQKVLFDCGLKFAADVFLCQTGITGKIGLPIGKALRFCSSAAPFCVYLEKRFGRCSCDEHAALNDAVYSKTGNYTLKLAKALIHAVIMSRRNP